MPHDIDTSQVELERIKGGKGRIRVTFRGEVLVEHRDPEFAACRALLARGITGMLVTRWKGSAHDAMRVPIERGARLSTSEPDRRKIGFVAFQPFKEDEGGGDCAASVPPTTADRNALATRVAADLEQRLHDGPPHKETHASEKEGV